VAGLVGALAIHNCGRGTAAGVYFLQNSLLKTYFEYRATATKCWPSISGIRQTKLPAIGTKMWKKGLLVASAGSGSALREKL